MSFILNKKLTVYDYINYFILTCISVICIIPLLYVISISFTDPQVHIPLQLQFIPKKFSLAAYRYILSTNSFMNALRSTVIITLGGTLCNLICTFTYAYALTKRDLPFRKFFVGMIVLYLIFGVGLIPNYLLIRSLGLINSYWALILGGLTNSWSLIVVRSFLDSLPKDIIIPGKK